MRAVICTLWLAASAGAGPGAADPLAIRWHLPDAFEAACARARAEERILLVKGVSFGIDEAGAACATKGRW